MLSVVRRRFAALTAIGIVAGFIGLAPHAAHAATGQQTSVPYTVGKGRGSGQWGFVGDVDTYDNKTTYSYGIGIDPVDGSLVVSDSGKVLYNALCQIYGYPARPCQTGNPRVFDYAATGIPETSLHEYKVNGQYASGTAANQSPGRNSGLGGAFKSLAERTTYVYPAPTTAHGPRGVTFADGKTYIVDSEAAAPATGPAGAISIFDANLAPSGGLGYTGTWAQRNDPGVMFYRTGTATTPRGTVLVNSEVSDRIQEFNPDGTFVRSILLDLPPVAGGDSGYRNPYHVAVDPVDGSMYISLINFRDDTYWTSRPAFLEKRDADGNVIARIGEGYLPKGQVVFGSAVDPVTQDVFVWSQNSTGFYQFTKDGAFIKQFTPTEFPGLTTPRAITFDKGGRLYVTVAEGTNSTRVMILGQTPAPTTATCAAMSADRKSVTLNYDCASDAGPVPYRQTPLLDYVIEQSADGGATWSVVPATAASTANTETITGLDPAATYQFRVSAWNEAGNGDWTDVQIAPVTAVDDTASTPAGTAVTVPVLENDISSTTPAPVPDSVQLIDPATGQPATTVTVTGEGTYTVVGNEVQFTPAATFAVSTTTPVTYRATYGACSTEASLTVTVGDTSPSLSVEKSINGDAADSAPGVTVNVGTTMQIQFHVTNTGDVPLKDIAIIDNVIAATDITCAPVTELAPGASLDCGATYAAPATPSTPHHNVATATGTPTIGAPTEVSSEPDHAYATTPSPSAITIVKSINGNDANTAPGVEVKAGSTMTIEFVVTNSGEQPLNDIVVTDDALDEVVCPHTSLDVGASMTCTAELVAPSGFAETHHDTGTVTATPASGGQTVSDSDEAFATTPPQRNPSITIDKKINGQAATSEEPVAVAAGSVATFTYVLTNTGDVQLDGIQVTDDKGIVVTCGQSTLGVGMSMTCSGTGTIGAGSYTNVGTVVGQYSGTPVEDSITVTESDSAHAVGLTALVEVAKYSGADPVAGDYDTAPGQQVDPASPTKVAAQVTNVGTDTLSGFEVIDENLEGIPAADLACEIPEQLAPGESFTCTIDVPALGYDAQHGDKVTVTATGTVAGAASSSDEWHASTGPAPVDPSDPSDPTTPAPVDPTGPSPTPTPPAPPSAHGNGALATTGVDGSIKGALSAILIAGGIVLAWVGRRRAV